MSPTKHLDIYIVHVALNPNHNALKCRLFGITLGEYTRAWFVNLPKWFIRSFVDLSTKFMAQFTSSKPIKRPTKIFHKIRQGPNETLRDYMTRFSKVVLTISWFVDETRQLAFISNIYLSKQYKYLLGHQKTLNFSNLIEMAATHSLIEEMMNSLSKLE